MATLMYAFKDTNSMSLDIIEPILNLAAAKHGLESDVVGVHADGFEVPRGGWKELVKEAKKEQVKYVIMVNLSKWGMNPDALIKDFRTLLDSKVSIIVAQMPFINNGVIHSSIQLAQAAIVVQSAQYYRDVKGLRIRAGHAKTDKTIGNTPYGMRRENGKLTVNQEEFENVRYIMNSRVSGVPVGDISRAMGPEFNYDKVYHIVQYWEGQEWEKN